MKRRIVLTVCAVLLAGALAQDTTTNVETRLSIVENRLGRLEADVSRLADVPTALARIEEKLTALSEKTGGWTGNLNTIGVGVIMLVIGGALGDWNRKRSTK